MNDLSRYLDVIVEPTFEEFKREPSSRRAFLVCVAIYHAIDRVAYPKSPELCASNGPSSRSISSSLIWWRITSSMLEAMMKGYLLSGEGYQSRSCSALMRKVMKWSYEISPSSCAMQ